MCAFNLDSQSSWQLMAKPIKCKQTSLLLTKEKYLFYYKPYFYLNDLHFNDFILFSSFLQLTKVVKLVPLQPHGRKYLSVKTANTWTVNSNQKLLSVSGRTPKLISSRKPWTLHMPPPPQKKRYLDFKNISYPSNIIMLDDICLLVSCFK